MDLAHKDEYSYLQQFATSTRKRNSSNLLLDLSTFAIKCEWMCGKPSERRNLAC